MGYLYLSYVICVCGSDEVVELAETPVESDGAFERQLARSATTHQVDARRHVASLRRRRSPAAVERARSLVARYHETVERHRLPALGRQPDAERDECSDRGQSG